MSGFINKKRQRLTLPRFTAVPSAQVVLTSLFGMGRGDPHRYSHLKVLDSYFPEAKSLLPARVTISNIVDNNEETVGVIGHIVLCNEVIG